MPRCARFYLMKHTRWLFVPALALLLLAAFLLQEPYLFVMGPQGPVTVVRASAGLPFSIHFIHSVQKTPVQENLIINGSCNGFELKSTQYQSFGVGLPFLESEGQFHTEGDYFIMDHMNRSFSTLSLRTGVGTELTLTVRDTAYALYRQFPPGSRVDIYIAPYYRLFV